MRALYDTGRWLTSFNFFEWLIQAKARGATKVVFDIRNIRGDKWPREVSRKRFYSICVPGCALADLPYEIFDCETIGSTQARDVAEANGWSLVAHWRKHGFIERLRSPRRPKRARYTVTLRRTQRAPGRNSDEEVWRDFAEEIGAGVIPDYDDEPTHLHERVALYAGARMNFFVSNGPAILCSLTEYPCMIFETNKAAGSLAGDGIPGWGAQYPWMLANQRAIWEDATAESIRRHFRHWTETGTFLDNPAEPEPAAA